MKYLKQSHTVYYARYHIVICTRYRRKILRWGSAEYVKRCVLGIMKRYPDIIIEKVNTDLDHMHLLASIPPRMAVSYAVNLIKSNTARMMRRRYKFLDKLYVKKAGIWSAGYFVSTVGADEEVIRKYIEYQGREDRGQAELAF